MNAKRIIPMVQIHAGQVLGQPAGPPVDLARRLEMAGADQVLFLEAGEPAGRGDWLAQVGRALFIPFSVNCGAPRGPLLEEALAVGADQVLLEVAPADLADLARASLKHGRNRLQVAVNAHRTAERDWQVAWPGEEREALAWIMELGQMGAGEILLSLDGAQTDPGELCRQAAQLAVPVLFRADGLEQGLEALLHGADGWVYGHGQGGPGERKAALARAGLALRG